MHWPLADAITERVNDPIYYEYATNLISIQQQAQFQFAKAKESQKRSADLHRTPQPSYVIGNKVWLSTKNLRIKTTKKFCPRFIGSFPIEKIINPVSVKLRLTSKYRFHPVSHVSLLKPYNPMTRTKAPPPSIEIEGIPEFEVKSILDAKRVRGKLFYLVDWKGYRPEERSWEPLANLTNAPHLVKAFHTRYPNKPKPIPQVLGGILRGEYCHESPDGMDPLQKRRSFKL